MRHRVKTLITTAASVGVGLIILFLYAKLLGVYAKVWTAILTGAIQL